MEKIETSSVSYITWRKQKPVVSYIALRRWKPVVSYFAMEKMETDGLLHGENGNHWPATLLE